MGASGGAWIASAPSADNILYEPNVAEAPVETPTAAIYNVPAGAAFTVARANGFSFNAGRQSSDGARHCTYQTMTDGALGLNVTYEGPNNLDSTLAYLAEGGVRLVCYFRMFGSRQLAAGWSFFGRTDYEPGVCGVGKFEFTNDRYRENPAFQVRIVADHSPDPVTTCLVHRWMISSFRLRGPAGADWRNAFQ